MLPLSTPAKDPGPEPKSATPQWLFLGEDEDLLLTIKESDEVILGCVYRVDFPRTDDHHAVVNLHVTVVRSFKGKLQTNERMVIELSTEHNESDPGQREKKLNTLRESDLGNLRFCFVQKSAQGANYHCEWLHVPKYTKAMNEFLEAHLQKASK